MRAMNGLQKLLMTVGAAGAALTLFAGPVVAVEEPAEETPTEEPAEGEAEEAEGERIPIAETPRDRIGLIMLAALLFGGGAAAVNARRQLKGQRPQATGDFRWR